ncbi:MAG: hypothetical protein V1659_03240 [Candidatus Woesearchaeota archaeon]
MEIKIDTERESKETLILFGEFLQKLGGRASQAHGSSQESFEPVASQGIFNLFTEGKTSSDPEQGNEPYPPPESTSADTAEQQNPNELFNVFKTAGADARKEKTISAHDLLKAKTDEDDEDQKIRLY